MRRRELSGALLYFILYFSGALLGNTLTYNSGFAVSFWPPSGIALAFLLLYPYKHWKTLIPAGIFANILFDIINGKSFLLTAFYSSGNTLEAVAGALIIRKYGGIVFRLDTVKQVLLLFFTALISTTISVFIGTTSTRLLMGFHINNGTWWSGDILGILIFTPLVITYKEWYSEFKGYSFYRLLELFTLFLLAILVSYLVFLTEARSIPHTIFLIFIPLLWSAFRFGFHSTVLFNAVLIGFAVYSTSQGAGIISGHKGNIPGQLFFFQFFSSGITLLSLIITVLIDSQNRMLKKYSESEDKFRRLVEVLSDAVLVNRENKIVYCNKAALKLFGTNNENDILGKTPYQIFHPDNHADIQRRIEIMLNENVIVPKKAEKILKVDGTIAYVEVTATPFVYYGSKAIHVVLRDITEKVKDEEELLRRQTIIDAILENSPIGFAVNTIGDGRAIYVAKKFEQIYGVEPGTLNSVDSYFENVYLDPEYREVMRKRILSDMESGIPERMIWDDVTIVTKDGDEKILFVMNIPVIESNLMISTVQDITERKKAQAALIESEERFRTLVSSMNEIVFTLDSEGKHSGVYGKWIENLGASQEMFIGKTAVDIFGRDAGHMHLDAHMRALKGESFIYEWSTGGNDNKYFATSLSPMHDSAGNVTGVVGIGRDITERKRNEAELEQHRNHLSELVEKRTKELDSLNKELVKEIEMKNRAELLLKESLEKEIELNSLKSKFISTASHEFKTPLTAIYSSIELLQRYSQRWNEEKINDYHERIKSSVNHLTSLIDDVLQISRTDSGRLFIKKESVNPDDICRRIIEDIYLNSDGRHKLNYEFISGSKEFQLDYKQTFIILQNLISNAVKYSPEGGEVDITISADNEIMEINVSDRGIGIPERELDKLFQPFYRAENIGSIKGTGLGLTIVKNAVELHNGTISVISKEGKGTQFQVKIPINC